MEDAAPALERQLGAKVDAAVGRQPGVIIDRLAAYRAAGALPPNVVVQIGENGPFWGSDQARLRQVLHGVPRVVLVNIRQRTSWEGQVNGALVAVARTWSQATIADWHSASANADLLWDGAHPKPAGQNVYARTVRAALGLRAAPTTPRPPVRTTRPRTTASR
jgi:lysophospholipase L1-like esterase